MIDLVGISKHYQIGPVEVRALDGVDLHVEDGEFVVVLGPSGSGKTTLLNIIGALDTPTAGSVSVNGRDITAASRAELFALRRQTVSVRRVLGVLAVEGVLRGAFAAVLGVVLGNGILLWIIYGVVPVSYPDMGFSLSFNVVEMGVFLAGRIAVVALAPTLTFRKLRRMDIPSTLRVLE